MAEEPKPAPEPTKWAWSKDPDGKVVQIDASQLAQAGQAGWKTPTVEEVHRARLGEEYGGLKGKAIAAGTGVASTLSAGVSDMVAQQAGFGTATRVSQEENPVSHVAGEIGGLLVPFGAVSEGASLGSGLAKAALGEGKGLVGKVARAAVRGAAESPAFTAQQLISESSLGDPSHVAENILPTLGRNALMFGAFSAGGELLASATKPAYDALSEKAGSLTDKFKAWNDGRLEAQKLGETMPGASLDERGRAAVEAMTDARAGMKEAGKAWGDIRAASREQLLKDVPVEQVMSSFDEIGAKANEMLGKFRDEKDVFAKSIADGAEAKIQGFQERLGKAKTSAEAHEALDVLKDQLYDVSGVSANNIATPKMADAVREVKGFAASLKQNLENPEVWGDAAVANRELNGAYSEWKKADDFLMTELGAGKRGQKMPSATKFKTWMNQGDAFTQDKKAEAFKTWVDKVNQFKEVSSKYADRTGVRVGDDAIEGLKTLTERNQKAIESVNSFAPEKKSFLEAQAKLAGEGTGHAAGALGAAGLVGSVLGHGVLGPLGVALGAGLKVGSVLSSAVKTQAALGKLQAIATVADKVMQKGVSAIVKHGVGASNVAARAATAFVGDREAEAHRIEQMNQLANDPKALMDRAAKVTEHLSADAPAVAGATAAAFVKQSQFLASKAPKTTLDGPFGPQAVKVSAAQLQKYSQYEQIARDPMKVLGHVRDGTLTGAHLETMRVLYPEQYRKMQTALISELTGMTPARRASLKGPRSLAISAFLGVPVSPVLSPDYMKTAQGVYGKQAAMPQAPKQSGAQMKGPKSWGTKQDQIRLGLH